MKHKLFAVLASSVLAMPGFAQDEYRPSDGMAGDGTFERIESTKTLSTPRTIAEAVAIMPVMPTVEQICSARAKATISATTYQPFATAIAKTQMVGLNESTAIRKRIDAAGRKQSAQNQSAMQQYNSNVNAGLMPSQEEMMQMMMSGEIDPSMSDEQMMDAMAGKFAQKWGVSKQEYLKIMGMSQSNPKQAEAYIKANHPQLYQRLYAANASYGTQNVTPDDPREARFAQIGEELKGLQEELMKAVGDYCGNGTHASVHTRNAVLDEMSDQLRDDWSKSAEAKQIDAIETALWIRVEEWERTLTLHGSEVAYPAWWTAERKKENALIDQWNHRNAQRWLKIASDGQKQFKTIFGKIAALETENEQLGRQGDTENMLYLMNKQLLCTLYGQLNQLIAPYDDVLQFPCIEHVEETGIVVFEKG